MMMEALLLMDASWLAPHLQRQRATRGAALPLVVACGIFWETEKRSENDVYML
jgi:hypothetical protein